MKFTITGKKLEVSEELRAYAEKKVGKIERLFRSGDSEAFITFSRERGRYTAEVTLKNNGMFYRVSETTGDMFASIDSACASIERQIRKNKTRLEKKLKAGPIEWTDTGVGPVDEEEESGDFTIVHAKKESQENDIAFFLWQTGKRLANSFVFYENIVSGDGKAVTIGWVGIFNVKLILFLLRQL